jgi:predicted GNAT family acetyltransferase
MAIRTRHNSDASRYEILDDDVVVGIADYQRRDDVTVFPHTEVVPARRGHGLGEQLVEFALQEERRAGRRVVATCWFVAEFIDAHPEYADLAAR